MNRSRVTFRCTQNFLQSLASLAAYGKFINKIIVLIIVALFISGCDSHYYHDEAVSYVPAIQEILVSSNKCKAGTNCSLVFVSGEVWAIGGKPYGGVNISVYNVFEPDVILKILTATVNNYQNHPSVETTIKIFSTAHHAEDEILMAELTL